MLPDSCNRHWFRGLRLPSNFLLFAEIVLMDELDRFAERLQAKWDREEELARRLDDLKSDWRKHAEQNS